MLLMKGDVRDVACTSAVMRVSLYAELRMTKEWLPTLNCGSRKSIVTFRSPDSTGRFESLRS